MVVVNNAYVRYIWELGNACCGLIPAPQIEYGPKRRVLLVHAHPLQESFSTSLSIAVRDELCSAGHEVRVRRLYLHDNREECYNGKEFPAVMSSAEYTTYADASSKRAKEVEEAINDLMWCNALVFVYPTWNFNFPAILKGYFDRVFLPQSVFSLPAPNTVGLPTFTGLHSHLSHIKKIGVVTTYGSSSHFALYAGDNSRIFISRTLRSLCAPRCQLVWDGMHCMDSSSDERRRRFVDEVRMSYRHF